MVLVGTGRRERGTHVADLVWSVVGSLVRFLRSKKEETRTARGGKPEEWAGRGSMGWDGDKAHMHAQRDTHPCPVGICSTMYRSVDMRC